MLVSCGTASKIGQNQACIVVGVILFVVEIIMSEVIQVFWLLAISFWPLANCQRPKAKSYYAVAASFLRKLVSNKFKKSSVYM